VLPPTLPEGPEIAGGGGKSLPPFGGAIFGQPTVSRPKGMGNMLFSQNSGVFAIIMAALLQVDGTVPCLHWFNGNEAGLGQPEERTLLGAKYPPAGHIMGLSLWMK